MRGTVISQRIVPSCRDLQNELNELLSTAEEACGTDRVWLTCIDLDADPPHHCRSHLGGSTGQMADATLEFLNNSHPRMACILVLGNQKITVGKCAQGYQMTLARIATPQSVH